MAKLLACRQFQKSKETPPQTSFTDILRTWLSRKLAGFATAQRKVCIVKYAVQYVKLLLHTQCFSDVAFPKFNKKITEKLTKFVDFKYYE